MANINHLIEILSVVSTKFVTIDERNPSTAMAVAVPFQLNIALLTSLSTEISSFVERYHTARSWHYSAKSVQ